MPVYDASDIIVYFYIKDYLSICVTSHTLSESHLVHFCSLLILRKKYCCNMDQKFPKLNNTGKHLEIMINQVSCKINCLKVNLTEVFSIVQSLFKC